MFFTLLLARSFSSRSASLGRFQMTLSLSLSGSQDQCHFLTLQYLTMSVQQIAAGGWPLVAPRPAGPGPGPLRPVTEAVGINCRERREQGKLSPFPSPSGVSWPAVTGPLPCLTKASSAIYSMRRREREHLAPALAAPLVEIWSCYFLVG